MEPEAAKGRRTAVSLSSSAGYLVMYSLMITLVWTVVLCITLAKLVLSGHRSVYATVEQPLLFAQCAAILEILHIIDGISLAPMTETFLMVASRLYVALWILCGIPEIQTEVYVVPLAISWSLTGILRHGFLAVSGAGGKEVLGEALFSRLMSVRRISYLLIHGLGFMSEMLLVFASLPYLTAEMPGKLCNAIVVGLCYWTYAHTCCRLDQILAVDTIKQ